MLYELMNGKGNLPYKTIITKMIELIKNKPRAPISDFYSVEIRQLVDDMLELDMNKRITIKEIFEKPFIKEEIYHLVDEYHIIKENSGPAVKSIL